MTTRTGHWLAISTQLCHLTKPYFSILFKTSVESSWETPGHLGGILNKIGPINSWVVVGCEGGGVCGGKVWGRVRFVRLHFSQSTNACLLNSFYRHIFYSLDLCANLYLSVNLLSRYCRRLAGRYLVFHHLKLFSGAFDYKVNNFIDFQIVWPILIEKIKFFRKNLNKFHFATRLFPFNSCQIQIKPFVWDFQAWTH